MRKIVRVLIVMLMFGLLTSCKKPDELLNFSKAFDNFSYSKITGYTYTKTQRQGRDEVYKQEIIHIIEKDSKIKAQTIFYEKKLGLFDPEHQFEVTNKITYYFDDSEGTYIDDVLVWKKKPFKDYGEIDLPKLKFKKDYFEEYTLNPLSEYVLLRGTLKASSTKDFFNIDEEIEDLFIEARIRDKRVQELKLRYTIDKSTVETSYKINYDKQLVTIPK